MLSKTLWDAPVERVDQAADEIDLIACAATGNEAATLRLFQAYRGVLAAAVNRYRRVLGKPDARQAAFEALLVAINEFDVTKADRLAGVLGSVLARVMAGAASDAGAAMAVPARTMQRFHRILALAGGDIQAGARLAPSYRMPADTFMAVADALNVCSLEGALEQDPSLTPEPLDPEHEWYADASVREMVTVAFGAVDDLEDDVCRLAYGFSDYDPLPDAEVGMRLGMGRTKTLRVRQGALAKMRDALAA